MRYRLIFIFKFLHAFVFALAYIAEERENPELLAESPTRRKRIAQESGKTEQQVCSIGFLCKLIYFILNVLERGDALSMYMSNIFFAISCGLDLSINVR